MAQPVKIKPDLDFVKDLQEVGGGSLKKCYQCATCSVACPVSPQGNPYPRKEMIWASWGMKDKLMADPDIWLCHNCNTCSDLCPRGAKPGDVMGAVRNAVYQNLISSRVAKWMSSPRYLPILIGIPAAIWAVIWVIMVKFFPPAKGQMFPVEANGKIVFGNLFYGDYTIDPIFMIAFFTSLGLLCLGVKRLINMFKPEGKTLIVGKKHWIIHLFYVVIEILTHKKFDECGQDKKMRKIGHMFLMYAFLALAVTTAIVSLGHWLPRFADIFAPFHIATPMPLIFPVKILGNLGALMLVIGLGVLTAVRLRQNKKHTESSWQDWYLLGVIWTVGITGILSQLFRLAEIAPAAFIVYYLHLVSVWMLFTYLPWTKLGHFVYRTTALTYIRYIGRR